MMHLFFIIIAGLSSSVYLHKHPIRGDVAVVVESLVFLALYAVIGIQQRHVGWTGFALSSKCVMLHVGSIIMSTIAYRTSPFHPLYNFPGPILNKVTSLRLLHMAYSGRRHLIIARLHEKYGNIVRTGAHSCRHSLSNCTADPSLHFFQGPNTLSINSQAAIAPIYATAAAMDRSSAYKMGELSGSSLFFFQDREKHHERRRIWAPAFTSQAIEKYMPGIEIRTHQLMECLVARRDSAGQINISQCFQHWAYDVMGDFTFGGSSRLELMANGDPRELVKAGQLAMMAYEILGEVPSLFQILWHLPTTNDIRRLERHAVKLMHTRRIVGSTAGGHEDIASYLLGENESNVSRSSHLPTEDLEAEALFVIQAGSDTTSGVLSFLFYFLLSHQTAFDRLQNELDAAFPDASMPLHSETLENLPFLNAVIDESLRLGTPFPGLPRVSPPGGAIIDGAYIAEGTIVSVPTYAQQISEENFWPEPLQFKPERWLPEGLGPGSRTCRSALMAFSFGPFGCLGKALAVQQLRLVTARLILTYHLTLHPSFDSENFLKGIRNIKTTLFPYALTVMASPRAQK
ncbi:cytochrome P450 monooxygenase 18-like protein [Heterobasidion irregulare TC 32-1]|uniref:Cytochrome P450 monooxygenase 18-like protein n=1 Tax=Heterobasidion irregulare (strain TC 32-1) TaxID=747525 RepID=W4JTK0_HETIT|nr:cytochrome P450 monooxygenase 18-like protein [Heterobasidion irregulare TC 32-1]ETW76221.1 cytochrome P450 monooxygenase 18-like protein [Heterobasidion irregulare TC 32-1]